MLKNHLLVALRTLRRRKGYAALNVVGLALGVACCILAGLYVFDEWRTDRFHERGDRIVRIVTEIEPSDGAVDWVPSVGQPVARTLTAEYPEVDRIVRLGVWNGASVRQGDTFVFDEQVLYASENFFEVFSFPLLRGDAATALAEPNTVVLTASAAAQFFGEADPLGRTLTIDEDTEVTVTGVAADPPGYSHLQFDVLVAWPTIEARGWTDDQWFSLNSYLYALLRPDADRAAFRDKLAGLTMRGEAGEAISARGYTLTNHAEPLAEVYLHSPARSFPGMDGGGDVSFLTTLAAVALFVLLIAGLNFVNLATAQSVERAKEVGVRKAIGAERGGLVRQFLTESVGLAGASVVAALALVALALPAFNALAGEALTLAPLATPLGVLALAATALVVGVLAGTYPAFALAGYAPVETLKGTFRAGSRGEWLRRGLVVVQFVLTIALIAGTLVAQRQVGFMRSQPLGFDAEQVYVVDLRDAPWSFREDIASVQAQFEAVPAVEAAAATAAVPGRSLWEGQLVNAEGRADDETIDMHVVPMDPAAVEALGLDLVAGRALSRDRQTDMEQGVLLNESAVRALGFASPQDALGKSIATAGQEDGVVTGVLRDYHHYGLQQAIAPTLTFVAPGAYSYLALRLRAGADVSAALAAAQTVWSSRLPNYPFDGFFLDDGFDQQYRAEERIATVFSVLAGLAILVACLGLLGLASYSVAQRTKEIGVRKVLGASELSIVRLFSVDIVRLVVVAALVAAPLVWIAAERWLAGYAVRVEPGLGTVVAAGGLALALALGTVAALAWRAARLDPVDALRYE